MNIDMKLSIIGLCLGIPFIIALVLFNFNLTYIIALALVIISMLIWVFFKKYFEVYEAIEKPVQFKLLASLYFIILTITIIIWHSRDNEFERPLLLFVFVAIMCGIIAMEIFHSSRSHSFIIIIQIIIVGCILLFSVTQMFPDIVGVDSYWHRWLTSKIIDNGSLQPGYDYSNMPIFHLLVGSTILILNVPYEYSAIVSISLVQLILGSLLIYLISRKVFGKVRIALLTALFATIGTYSVFMTLWAIPTTLAMIFVLITYYIIIKNWNQKTFLNSVLSIFFMFTLILTHTVTSVLLALIIFVIWVSNSTIIKMPKKNSKTELFVIFVLFITTMLFWWSYASGLVIVKMSNLLSWGFSRDLFVRSLSEYSNAFVLTPLYEHILIYLGIFMYFSISIIGILFMLSKKGNELTSSYALAGMAPLIISFIALVSGKTLLDERWWFYSQILLSLPVACAIFLIHSPHMKKYYLASIMRGCIVGLIVFLMIATPLANFDSHPLTPSSGVRYSPTESEIQAIRTSHALWQGDVAGDKYYAATVMANLGFSYKLIDESILTSNYSNCTDSMVLVRSEIVSSQIVVFDSPIRLNYNPNDALSSQGYSKIYVSGSVTGYRYLM